MRTKPGSSCLTHEQWANLKALWHDRCAYCGVRVTARMHAEHMEPLSRGGEDVPGNVVPSCSQCNNSKKSLFLLEWVFVQHGLLVQPVKALPLRVAPLGHNPNTAAHLRETATWVPSSGTPFQESGMTATTRACPTCQDNHYVGATLTVCPTCRGVAGEPGEVEWRADGEPFCLRCGLRAVIAKGRATCPECDGDEPSSSPYTSTRYADEMPESDFYGEG